MAGRAAQMACGRHGPENVSYEEYFDVDNVGRVVPDESPRYPITVVEEDDEFITIKNEWGTTVRNFKMQDSTPDFIDHTIIDWDTWLAAKERITPDRDRIQWDYLQKNYKEWVKEGRWLLGDVNFTFNTLSSTVMGMERFLVYMVTDPELCMGYARAHPEGGPAAAGHGLGCRLHLRHAQHSRRYGL